MQMNFKGSVELKFTKELGNQGSAITGCDLFLQIGPNLKKEAYLTETNQLTEQGWKMLTQCLVHGLATSIMVGVDQHWCDDKKQFNFILSELAKAMEHQMTSHRHHSGYRGGKLCKSTTKELVDTLTVRNTNGKYNGLIKQAMDGWFHDFKQPSGIAAPPKLLLLEKLSQFPELSDIESEVHEGIYDESPDEDDRRKMVSDLTPSKN